MAKAEKSASVPDLNADATSLISADGNDDVEGSISLLSKGKKDEDSSEVKAFPGIISSV